MYNLIDDLQVFTAIPKTQLNSLATKSILDIAHCIKESVDSNSDCNINIGIGNLVVEVSNDEMAFKFIPSDELQECVLSSLRNDKSDLQFVIERSCSEKMLKVYKELF